MTEHAVVIAGGGPTGLMLAGELALAGVDVAIVERRPTRTSPARARAVCTHAHRGSRSAWDRRSVPVGGAGGPGRGVRLQPLGHQRLSHPAQLRARAVAEPHRAHPGRLGRRAGGDVLSRTRGDGLRRRTTTASTSQLSDGESLRAAYLVGCDGGRSLVRKAAGIDFPGWDPTMSALLAEVEVTEEPELGIRQDELGTHAFGRMDYEIRDGEVVYADEGPVGVMVTETQPGRHDRTDAARSQRGAHHRLRDRLRGPQSDVDHKVHRHDPAGRVIPGRTGAACRRRGTHAFPGGRTRAQHRRAGCGEPGMEAGPGRQGDIAREPSRHVPRRAPPRRLRACCRTRWRKPCSCVPRMRASRPCARP